jgi:hypothetical protein
LTDATSPQSWQPTPVADLLREARGGQGRSQKSSEAGATRVEPTRGASRARKGPFPTGPGPLQRETDVRGRHGAAEATRCGHTPTGPRWFAIAAARPGQPGRARSSDDRRRKLPGDRWSECRHSGSRSRTDRFDGQSGDRGGTGESLFAAGQPGACRDPSRPPCLTGPVFGPERKGQSSGEQGDPTPWV